MIPDGNFAGTPPNDTHLKVPANYKVNLIRNGSMAPHNLVFSVSPQSEPVGEGYFLVGVYFVNRVLTNSGQAVGQHVFRQFQSNLASDPPTLTLSLTRGAVEGNEKYEFMFLIQRRSDGALGIIDPEWENE
jgi:hypothetical protein